MAALHKWWAEWGAGSHQLDSWLHGDTDRTRLIHRPGGPFQEQFFHRWKCNFDFIQVVMKWSLWNFAHGSGMWKILEHSNSALVQVVMKWPLWNFCTCHDSCAVVACAKFYSGMIHYSGGTLKPIFNRIWITMKKKTVCKMPGWPAGIRIVIRV